MSVPLCERSAEKRDLRMPDAKKNAGTGKKWGKVHENMKKMCYFCPCMKNT